MYIYINTIYYMIYDFCYIILYHITSYIVLYYIVLYCIILYYIIYVYVYGSDPTRRYWPQVWHRSLEALQIGGLFTLKNWVSGLMFVDLGKLLGTAGPSDTHLFEKHEKRRQQSEWLVCNKRKGLIISTHPTVLERIKKKHIQFRIIIPAMEILKSLETTKC